MDYLDSKRHGELIDRVFAPSLRVDMSVDSFTDRGMCRVVADDTTTPSVFMLENSIFRIFAGDQISLRLAQKLGYTFVESRTA